MAIIAIFAIRAKESIIYSQSSLGPTAPNPQHGDQKQLYYYSCFGWNYPNLIRWLDHDRLWHLQFNLISK